MVRHVETMDEYRMGKRVLMADVSGGRLPCKPRLSLTDCVKVSLSSRGMTMGMRDKQCAKDMKEWRALVHM